MSNRVSLNVIAAAEAVNVGPTKIRQEIKAGRLVAHRAGKLLLISTDDLRAWVNSLPRYKDPEHA
jgi:excisionase family DNA binding protein